MLERLSDNPFAFVTGCAVWIPLSIWVVVLVGWMITAEIETVTGVLGVALAFVIGYLSLEPPTPILPPLLFATALATLILTPIAQVMMKSSEMRSIDVDAVEKAYDLLVDRPQNEGAKVRMARCLFNLGYVAHAVDIAEQALSNADKRIFREDLHVLNTWKQRLSSPRIPPLRAIVCVHCGKSNMPHKIFCERCGARFLADYIRGRFLNPGLKAKLLVAWLGATFLLVGVPLLASTLPLVAAVIGIAILLIVGTLFLIGAWKRIDQRQ